jgi:hypothetical protein
VTQAFALGWNICLLYLSGATPAWRQWKQAPERLPSPSRFSKAERALIRLSQVRSTIDHFSGSVATSGRGGSLLSAAGEHVDQVNSRGPGAVGGIDPRVSLCEAHLALAEALSASDARLAKAYHLGGELATVCHAPNDFESLQREFKRSRIARLGEWLADLTSLFPDHASRAVRLSCDEWRRWVENPQISEVKAADSNPEADSPGAIKRAAAFATGDRRAMNWDEDGKEVRRSLRRQGEVWRALLAGEKPGAAMLELQDYFATGARALRNAVRLFSGVMIPLLFALALLAIGSWLLVKNEGAGAKVAGLVTVAGAVGITWKGIFGGLGTVVGKLQGPVWGAALDEEIAAAITELPAGAKVESVEATKAAPASGPPSSVLAPPEENRAEPDWAI